MDMALESLKLLEARINVFLARHERVCSEKDDLLTRLRERERAYTALIEQVRQYEKERDEVREKLEKILSRFNVLDTVDEDEG